MIDWLTGWYKSRKKKEESSKVGAIGAMKKVGYWAIVLVAFVIGDVFVKLGHDVFGLELTFLHMIGWFTMKHAAFLKTLCSWAIKCHSS